MACVPSPPTNRPGPKDHLQQLFTLISTLRGGDSRYLPLILTKIRDTLPAIADQFPTAPIHRAAPGTMVGGSAFGPFGGINGLSGTNGFNGISGAVMNGLNATAWQREGCIKQEPTSGSSGSVSASVSDSGSPYSTPPFMHYYPLA